MTGATRPNIHFLSTHNFEDLCRTKGSPIERRYFLVGIDESELVAEFTAQTAVFLVGRSRTQFPDGDTDSLPVGNLFRQLTVCDPKRATVTDGKDVGPVGGQPRRPRGLGYLRRCGG